MVPMYAVVSLLDEAHYRQVEELWDQLKDHCCIAGIYRTPFPHFSYHVAPGYDLALLRTRLEQFARTTPPFRVRTAGLGIFTGPNPVIYMPVVRSPLLSALHQALWPAVEETATGGLTYYQPDLWIPHITLGHGDLCHENLGPVVQFLNQKSLVWEIAIENLAVISSTGSPDGLYLKLPLTGT